MANGDTITGQDPTARVEANSDELAVAFSGPSYAVGKFYITLNNTGVRIAFAEASPVFGQVPMKEAVSFRTAVTLAPVDAIALHRILRGMVREIEAEMVKVGAIPPEQT